MKSCNQCGQIKELDLFTASLTAPDGKRNICKRCTADNEKAKRHSKPDHYRELDRKRYALNPESKKVGAKKWYQHNRKRSASNHRAWTQSHRERARELSRNYMRKHPEFISIKNNQRRAKKANVRFEKILSKEIFERDNWVCRLCLKKVNKNLKWPNQYSATIDHIIPLSKGGNHVRNNLQTAHLICNRLARDNDNKQLLLFG